jgi:hypothetical protein
VRGLVVKYLRAPLLELFQDRQVQLLGIGDASQAGDFRGQFERLRDEALIFAIEEETDLAKRFKVMLLGQLHHRRRI